MNNRETLKNKNLIKKTYHGNILILEFDSTSQYNPFNKRMENELANIFTCAQADPNVKAVVITGGENKSFSVGGDFNEIKKFVGGNDVEEWLDDVFALYISALKLSKPLIAAIDHYAIGIGFQLAITCDWRIGTNRCQFIMPELKHGISCVIGQYMLEKMFGRASMLEIIYGSELITIDKCLQYRLINTLVEPNKLLDTAIKITENMIKYPQIPFTNTKKVINDSYIRELTNLIDITKLAHKQTFTSKCSQKFMKTIVDR